MLGQLINHYFQLTDSFLHKTLRGLTLTALHVAPKMDTLWAPSAASRASSRAKADSLN